eukprot:7667-Eustigmatos_ZCMA.PRE.1
MLHLGRKANSCWAWSERDLVPCTPQGGTRDSSSRCVHELWAVKVLSGSYAPCDYVRVTNSVRTE